MNQPLTIWKTALNQKRPYLSLGDGCRTIGHIIRHQLFDTGIYNIVTENLTVESILIIIKKFGNTGFIYKGSIEKSIKDTIDLLKNSIIVGTFNVLEASREYKIKRFIYVNSAACFGIADKYPTPEDAPKNPQYPYALMKWLGEELAIHWSQVYDLPVISLRFFNLYGKRASALFGLFVSKKLDGNPLTITGDGTQTRDFTYIGDIVDGIYTAAMSEKVGEIYNIGSGKTVSVNKIAELFEAEIEYIPRRSGEMDITYGDITKAKKELNWKPKMEIEEGVPLVLKEIFNQKK